MSEDAKDHAGQSTRFEISHADLKPKAMTRRSAERNSLIFSTAKGITISIRPLAVRCDPRDHERSRSLGASAFLGAAA
jgi:hypothetical protein